MFVLFVSRLGGGYGVFEDMEWKGILYKVSNYVGVVKN